MSWVEIVREKSELEKITYRFRLCDSGAVRPVWVRREYRPTKRHKVRCEGRSMLTNYPANVLPPIPDDVIAEAVAFFRDRIAYEGKWG